MKIYYFILIFIISNTVTSQTTEIIAKGSYINKLNDDPLLWILFYKNDSLKLYSNNPLIHEYLPKPKEIISIDILKDKLAENKIGDFAQNGIVVINAKKKYWKKISSYKNNLSSNDIAIDVSKTIDTIHLENSQSNFQFEQELVLNNNYLRTRKKGENHISNNLKLFLTSTERGSISDKKIVNLDSVKKIIPKQISLINYSEISYALIFDMDANKLIWNVSTFKEDKNGVKYIDKEGFYTTEAIEIDAINGKTIKQTINNKVQIMIR